MKGFFINPLDGEIVGSRIHVCGGIEDLKGDVRLWIVHRRTAGGAYWPKEPEITCRQDGTFELTTIEGGSPGSIVISLLAVSNETSSSYEKWLQQGHKTGHYPCIGQLEYQAEELTSVNVQYSQNRPLNVFISYAHEDENHLKSLQKHLALLKRQGFIEMWHDREIVPGADFSMDIHTELSRADIILLLVSASFLYSDYCYEKEMAKALQRHNSGKARLVPIIIRAVDWHSAPFGHLLALPKDGKPVDSWDNEDEAWTDITRGIRRVIKELR
jgi:hypothetical protein